MIDGELLTREKDDEDNLMDVEWIGEWSERIDVNCGCVASGWKYAIGEELLSADGSRGEVVGADCGRRT